MKPPEINPIIKCSCGCGKELNEYDNYGRKRKYLIGHFLRNKTLKTLWKKINKTNGCWEWTGAKTTAGYGSYTMNQKRGYVHRLIYEQYYGEIPKGLSVLHKCDNPKCVRPDHLFLGTKGDNHEDAMNKKRAARDLLTGQFKRGEHYASV